MEDEGISMAEETRRFIEKQDEGLIDLILSDEPNQEPYFELKNIHCPLCQGDTIQITETAEGDSERVFFQMKCLDCGCEFVLFEDFINACHRGIENAKNDIEYSKSKIDYFENKLRLAGRECRACEQQAENSFNAGKQARGGALK